MGNNSTMTQFKKIFSNIFNLNNPKILNGFTLIETLVAVGIFTVIMLTAIGSLVVTNQNHKVARNMKILIDNVNFSMEDMARNIRVGSNIMCVPGYFPYFGDELPEVISDVGIEDFTPSDCPTLTSTGGVVYFESAEGDPENKNDQYGYAIFYQNHDLNGRLYKTTDSGNTWISMTPPNIIIDFQQSGFIVEGASSADTDLSQPYVTIRLKGEALYKTNSTSFDVQTGAALRYLDI